MTFSLEQRALKILKLLDNNYVIKNEEFLNNYKSPFQLLVAAILSAQSTDKQVNEVTQPLFKRFPNPSAFADASKDEIEKHIASVGLYRTKAKYIHNMSSILVEKYNSKVPQTINELTKLPGVGRKTANVLLNDWFDKNEGIAVDTHVKRISFRLGLTNEMNPTKIENELKELFPESRWGDLTHLFITHGRRICKARLPECTKCFLNEICEKNGVEKSK